MTRSELERRFLKECEAAGIALPEVNVVVEGWTVDALWRAERVVVELDGRDNHSSPARSSATAGRTFSFARPVTWSSATPGPRSSSTAPAVMADLRAILSRPAKSA